MRSYSLNRLTWAILLCLFSSTFVSVRIAKGNEEDGYAHNPYNDPQHHQHESPTDGDTDAVPVTEAQETVQEATESVVAEGAAPPPAAESPSGTCDVSSVSSTLSGKIEALESKFESLVSKLTGEMNVKLDGLKDSVSSATSSQCGSSSGGESSSSNGNGKPHKNFDACLESLTSDNLPEAVTQWDLIEKETFGPTAKATLLKDLLFLAYEKSKGTSVKFVQELMNASKKYLPPIFDTLKEAMKLNSDNIFSLAITIKKELGQDSALFTKLPQSVRSITSGKTVRLSYPCKTNQKKLELHVRDDDLTWEREYWPVVASSTFNLNHTKGALWTFEPTPSGNFQIRNSWFGDYLWIEPNYQNLRTVDESTKSRNGTEFSLSLNEDGTMALHSVYYKSAPVIEGYFSRKSDTTRPLRVSFEQPALAFNVEESTKTH